MGSSLFCWPIASMRTLSTWGIEGVTISAMRRVDARVAWPVRYSTGMGSLAKSVRRAPSCASETKCESTTGIRAAIADRCSGDRRDHWSEPLQ